MRSLQRDRFSRGRAMLASGLVLLAAWCAWMLFARVGVYVSSRAARLEVDRSTHAVQPSVGGTVVRSSLSLGRTVALGESLVELDATIERGQLAEEQARLDGFERQLVALRSGTLSVRSGQIRSGERARAAVAEARSRVAAAESAARYADDLVARTTPLVAGGSVAQSELERLRADAQQRHLEIDARRSELDRLERELHADRSDRQVDIERTSREIAELEADAAASRAAIARLRREIELRSVRATVAGRIGDVVELVPGSVVESGDHLASIVPTGALRIVASFPPPAAFGRIAPGQSARLRVSGFPWTQFGAVPATVRSVGGEVREGLVRVELALDSARSPIPLQHGLSGDVEIEVERTSPAVLVLRTVGAWLADDADDRVASGDAAKPEAR
jgi:membrane fusion protein (multidrug efflux system)